LSIEHGPSGSPLGQISPKNQTYYSVPHPHSHLVTTPTHTCPVVRSFAEDSSNCRQSRLHNSRLQNPQFAQPRVCLASFSFRQLGLHRAGQYPRLDLAQVHLVRSKRPPTWAPRKLNLFRIESRESTRDTMAQIRGTAGYHLGGQSPFGGPGNSDATNDPSPLDAIREQTSKIEDFLDTMADPIKPYVIATPTCCTFHVDTSWTRPF
jgi:hypothetical protein